MRIVECRNTYIDVSQSNVSATLRGDLLRSPFKIIARVPPGCLHSDDVSL
ncbi:conserved hypothetical protein [Streptomyces misionensis JCM 4497]